MNRSKSVKSLLMVLAVVTVLAFAWGGGDEVYAKAAKVTSAKNISTGVQVKWNEDKTVKGYYVFRKADGGKWTRVAKIKKTGKTKWIDRKALNGNKYSYKVEGYKGKAIKKNNKTATVVRLKTPKIRKIRTAPAGALVLGTSSNSKAAGYQIVYSRNKNFSKAKRLNVTGTKISSRQLKNLKWGKKYYVKVRSYVKNGGRKYYSAFSKAKTKKSGAYIIAYTKNAFTSAKKKKNGSSGVKLPYKSKVRLYTKLKRTNSNRWVKIKFNGKTYYVYVQKKTMPFTSKAVTYSDYKYNNIGPVQQQVVYDALNIYENYPTNYSHREPGTIVNGKMQFDCSGFVSYIVNGVMREYIPSYKITANITGLYETDEIYTDANGVFKQTTVCKGVNYSKMRAGDIIYFDDRGEGEVNHVGIYLGNKEFIHSTKSTDGVSIMPLPGKYAGRVIKVKRIVPTTEPKPINKSKSFSGSIYNDPSFHEKIDSYSGTVKVMYYQLLNYTDDYQAAYISYGNGSNGVVMSNKLR